MLDYELRVADLVFTRSDVDRLPLGTVLRHGGERYEKREGGWHNQHYGLNPTFEPDRNGGTSITSLPSVPTIGETVERYQWKLRDVCLVAGVRHSVSGVPQTLDRLELPQTKFPVGVGMRVLQPAIIDDLRYLPEHSMISYGSPDHPDFAMFLRGQEAWRQVFGPPNFQRRGWAMVEEVGGIGILQNWLERTPAPDEEQRILDFKAKAWDVGVQARSEFSWCGTFVEVMTTLGITDQAPMLARRGAGTAGSSAGMRLPLWQCAQEPVGTMFEYVNSDGHTFWYQRQEGASNRALTRRWCGWDEAGRAVGGGGHYATGMTVVGHSGDVIDIPSPDARERWRALPNGTSFRYTDSPSNTYRKTGEDTFVDHISGSGGYTGRTNMTSESRLSVILP